MNKEELTLILSGFFSWLVVFILDKGVWSGSPFIAFVYFVILAIFLWFSYSRVNPQHRKGLRGGLVTFAILCLSLIYDIEKINLTPILLVIWAALIAEVYKLKVAITQLVVVNLIYIGFIINGELSADLQMKYYSFIVFEFFAFSSTMARLRERYFRNEHQKKHTELVAMRSLLNTRTQMEDRLRISRELHTSVGTKLTALSLQVEQAKQAPQRDYQGNLDLIKQELRQTLHELKVAVNDLRNSSQRDLKKMLEDLVVNLPNIDVKVPEPVLLDDPDLVEKLFLALQEGINNAIEHGAATRFVLVKESSNPLTLKLSNNGRSNENIEFGDGMNKILESLKPYEGQVALIPNPRQQGMSLFLKVEK